MKNKTLKNSIRSAGLVIILNSSLFAQAPVTKLNTEKAKIIKEQIVKVLSAGAGGSAAIFTTNDRKILVTHNIDGDQILSKACLDHLLGYLKKSEITADRNYQEFFQQSEEGSDYTGFIWLYGRNIDLTINFLEGEYARFYISVKQNGIKVQSYATEEFILKGYEEMLYEMAVISQDTKWHDDPKGYERSSTAFDDIAEDINNLVNPGENKANIDEGNDKVQEAGPVDEPKQNLVKPSDAKISSAQKNDEIQESAVPEPESNLWKWLTGFIILLVTSIAVKFLAFRK